MSEERDITWMKTSATALIESNENINVGDTITEKMDGKTYEMEAVETGVLDDKNKFIVEVISIDGWEVPETTVLEF